MQDVLAKDVPYPLRTSVDVIFIPSDEKYQLKHTGPLKFIFYFPFNGIR